MEENNHSNRPGNGNGGGGDNKNPKNRQSILTLLIMTLVGLMVWQMVTGNMGSGKSPITYDEFMKMLEEGLSRITSWSRSFPRPV